MVSFTAGHLSQPDTIQPTNARCVHTPETQPRAVDQTSMTRQSLPLRQGELEALHIDTLEVNHADGTFNPEFRQQNLDDVM